MKLLTKKDRMYNTNELHTGLQILKVKHIYEVSTLIFVFRCHKETPIEPFKEYFKQRGEGHNHDLRNIENLSTNQIRLNMGQNTTHTNGATLWNSCPSIITGINTLGTFKKCLKVGMHLR